MFIYASLLGIASMNGMIPVFPGPGELTLLDTFKSLVAVDNARSIGFKLNAEVSVSEISDHRYDDRFEEIHTLSARVIKVGHYLQSWRYFTHIEPTIRRQFTFKDSYVEHASNFLRQSVINSG
jgi:Glycosyl transferase family 11